MDWLDEDDPNFFAGGRADPSCSRKVVDRLLERFWWRL